MHTSSTSIDIKSIKNIVRRLSSAPFGAVAAHDQGYDYGYDYDEGSQRRAGQMEKSYLYIKYIYIH